MAEAEGSSPSSSIAPRKIFHLALSHRLPADGTSGSALIAHLPGGDERIPIEPGEAVLERAHGTIHQFEPLKPDEERVLAAIAYRRGPGGE